MPARCVALLGGSFDPVHNGHVALAEYLIDLLAPDELRIIPAGNPWQKHGLQASAEDRVEMLRCAFAGQRIPVTIDLQEIRRPTATYTIDTLRTLRAELGPQTAIIFLMGADQLQQLNTWREWQHLFDYAHFCAASRPGFAMEAMHLPEIVAREFERRAATPEQMRTTPHGLTYVATGLAVDISATEIRTALRHGDHLDRLLPAKVLDYIQHHHLYQY
ncbi:MAG TPA: nicotinate-nucleotide adenylyltransferase [Burkholderiaceae bacterium]|nr:nicotinate-nucleotide adenylyltransferase [Burkholderiaceae bacterium]